MIFDVENQNSTEFISGKESLSLPKRFATEDLTNLFNFSKDGSLVWGLLQGNIVKAVNLISKEQRTLPITRKDAMILASYLSADLSQVFYSFIF